MALHSTPVRTHTHKAGTCPHGLPIGACPICSGMAGGNSTSKRDIPRNVGEMTYNQCAAIGAMLKAQRLARESAKQAQLNHIQALVDFQKNLNTTHNRLVEFAQNLKQILPPIIANPISFIVVNIVAHIVFTTPNIIINSIVQIREKLLDISDKLVAIYGEVENFVKDKISKLINSIKKKLKFSLFVFGTSETDDEEKKIEEAKRTFELKTFIQKLTNNLTKKETQQNAH